jgi:hypothetical protein
MTWNSSPLRLNPPSRASNPLPVPKTPDRVRVFEAAEHIGQLNNLAAEPETYLIAKKHTKNIENLHRILVLGLGDALVTVGASSEAGRFDETSLVRYFGRRAICPR